MAEYDEVMRQRARMCASFAPDCVGCEARGLIGIFRMCTAWFCDESEKAQEITMRWAAEHPEPRYPTWEEWWRKTFPHGSLQDFCPLQVYDGFDCHNRDYWAYRDKCDKCMRTPIPADIANKLGIKPIEEDAE